jgi:hypothetical protein
MIAARLGYLLLSLENLPLAAGTDIRLSFFSLGR